MTVSTNTVSAGDGYNTVERGFASIRPFAPKSAGSEKDICLTFATRDV